MGISIQNLKITLHFSYILNIFMALSLFLLFVGLGVLVLGADALVKGASSLAKRLGISTLAIGLTVVAFGTSMPEMVVSLYAAWQGNAAIAIGNIVGSNIANLLLILGVSAAITTLTVKSTTVWKEIPFALLAMILVYTMGNDRLFDGVPFNVLTRTDGFSLISLFIIFLVYTYGLGKVKSAEPEEPVKIYSDWLSVLLSLVGILLLAGGGKVIVDNAVILARVLGMSDALIGLTIVAVGTSLPELATSVVAAMRRQSDIVIGNVIGSNIFNVFWILGLSSTVAPLPFTSATNVDVLVGIAATLFTFLALFVGKKHKFERWQGVLFVISYIAYLWYLIARG